MKWLGLTLALAAPSSAYIRFGCATLSVQRLDPVVEVCSKQNFQAVGIADLCSQETSHQLTCTRQVRLYLDMVTTIAHVSCQCRS